MPQIELRNVAKSYGAVDVIKGVSLEISEGEFVVLVGPSGCGKSTLLRMIAGLEKITGGEVLIGGKVVNDKPPKDRDIAMVFQNYALYPHMKVAENMSFSLKLAGSPKSEIERRVGEAAAILGLEPLLHRLPRELSGGQRQRVAMGRAIVRDPRAFLFDEPLSNLDAKLRGKVRGEIKKLHARLGRTMIYVTHDQTEAMTMADRIVVMNAGRIEQLGPPLSLYRDPDNLFVASFIGSPEINLLDADVRDGNAILPSGVSVPLGRTDFGSSQIVLGIRPQHIRVGSSGVTGEISLLEPTGEDQLIVVMVGQDAVTAIVDGREPYKIGQELHLQFPADRILLFDRATKQRIR